MVDEGTGLTVLNLGYSVLGISGATTPFNARDVEIAGMDQAFCISNKGEFQTSSCGQSSPSSPVCKSRFWAAALISGDLDPENILQTSQTFSSPMGRYSSTGGTDVYPPSIPHLHIILFTATASCSCSDSTSNPSLEQPVSTCGPPAVSQVFDHSIKPKLLVNTLISKCTFQVPPMLQRVECGGVRFWSLNKISPFCSDSAD